MTRVLKSRRALSMRSSKKMGANGGMKLDEVSSHNLRIFNLIRFRFQAQLTTHSNGKIAKNLLNVINCV